MLLHRSLTRLSSNRGIADKFLDELLSLYKSTVQTSSSSSSQLTSKELQVELEEEQTLLSHIPHEQLTNVQRLLQQLLVESKRANNNKSTNFTSTSNPKYTNNKNNETETDEKDDNSDHVLLTLSFVKRLMQVNPHVSFQEVLLRWKATVNHPMTSAAVLPHTPLAEAQLLNQKINQLDEFTILKGPEKLQDVNIASANHLEMTNTNHNNEKKRNSRTPHDVEEEEDWQRKEREFCTPSNLGLAAEADKYNNNICMWEVLCYYSAAHFAAELGDKELFDFCKNELHDGVPFIMRNEEVKINSKRVKTRKDICTLWPLPPKPLQEQESELCKLEQEEQHEHKEWIKEEKEEEELEQLFATMITSNTSVNASSQQATGDKAKMSHDMSNKRTEDEKIKNLTKELETPKNTKYRHVHGLVAFDVLATQGFDYNGAYLSHYAAQSGQIDIMHELINAYGAQLILREQIWQRPINMKLIWGPPSHLIGLSASACAIAFGQMELLQWLHTHYAQYLNTLPRQELYHSLLALGMQLDEEKSGFALLDFLWNHHLLVPTSATVLPYSTLTTNSSSSEQELQETERTQLPNIENEEVQQQENELKSEGNMWKATTTTTSNSQFAITTTGKVSLVELCEGKEAMAMLFAAAESGNYTVTNWFVKTFGEEVLWMPGRGESTYLHHCARGGNVKLLKHLLCERRHMDCASLHKWIDVPDNEERTPAVWAVIGGKRGGSIVEVLSLLLECGSHWKTYRNLHGRNLYEIAKERHSSFSKLCRYLRKEVVQ